MKLNWSRAEAHLIRLVAWYITQGPWGRLYLAFKVFPLKRRYERGERTSALYSSIINTQ